MVEEALLDRSWALMASNPDKSLDSEVGSYVLAYLLQNNFTASANAFLRECKMLPSKTLIVLPETPLHVLVAEHNARLNAKVLVNTLGSESAWKELWGKLGTTLNQIRYLSEELNNHHFQPTTKMKGKSRLTAVDKSGVETSHKPVFLSPQKRKQGPRRKVQHSFPTTSPKSSSISVINLPEATPVPDPSPNSPTMQQVLDTFLDDVSFPGKLAGIINQCVSSDVGGDDLSSDISSETLERILATLSEPLLEDNMLESSSKQNIMGDPPPDIPHEARLEGVPPPDTLYEARHKGILPLSTRQVEVTLLDRPQTLPASTEATTSNISLNDSPSLAAKRPRIDETSPSLHDFPSEQDIDSFLDQLHEHH